MPSPNLDAAYPRRPVPAADDPLRIAYLAYRGKPHCGGQGVYTRHLTKALVDLGHHVEVLAGPPYPDLDERVPLV
ncbi:MAG: glycosyltransferase, partial [Acidimicrobiales bacterium]